MVRFLIPGGLTPPIIASDNASSDVNIFYESTANNQVNGTSGACVNAIAANNINRDAYVWCSATKVSGNAVADLTASFSSGTPTLITQLRSGVYATALYKVASPGSVSLTGTLTNGTDTFNTFVTHCWTSTLLAVSYQGRQVVTANGADPTFAITVGHPGFVLFNTPHASALTGLVYTGSDVATANFSANIETSRYIAGNVYNNLDSGAQTLTVQMGTAANCGCAAMFF